MIEDLTGLRLAVELSLTSGETPLLMDDLIGFRAMSGGIDGDTVALPTHLPTPTRLLTLAMVAEEASGHVVSTDLEASQDQRVLLLGADENTTSEGEIRTELVHLHRRLFGRVVDPDGPEIDDVYALWKVVADDDGAEAAWEVVVAALLQSPDILFYLRSTMKNRIPDQGWSRRNFLGAAGSLGAAGALGAASFLPGSPMLRVQPPSRPRSRLWRLGHDLLHGPPPERPWRHRRTRPGQHG